MRFPAVFTGGREGGPVAAPGTSRSRPLAEATIAGIARGHFRSPIAAPRPQAAKADHRWPRRAEAARLPRRSAPGAIAQKASPPRVSGAAPRRVESLRWRPGYRASSCPCAPPSSWLVRDPELKLVRVPIPSKSVKPRTRTSSQGRHRAGPDPLAKLVGARIRELRLEAEFTFDAFVEETGSGAATCPSLSEAP
jgi:hypothetical protein